MSSRFLRCLILTGCGALVASAGSCSSDINPGGGAGAGGNATAGAAGHATGGASGGSSGGASGGASGAAGTPADAAASDAASAMTYFFTFKTAAEVSAAAVGNPADTSKGDLGVFAATDGGPRATTSFDMTVGNPDLGSLEVQIPCNAYGQFVDYQLILPVITDLGKKTLSLMMRLDSGFSPDAASPGDIYLYAKSGDNWDWAQGNSLAIAPSSAGEWIQYTFPMASLGAGSTPAFDPGYVKAIGIHLETGGGSGATAPPTPAVFHIDSIGYQ